MRGSGVREEAVQDARQVEPPQNARHLVAGKHVGGNEAPQRLA